MASSAKFNHLKPAYAACYSIVNSTYENFPVASILLPKHLRQAIAAIYAFARTADNYADSPNLPALQKNTALNHLSEILNNIAVVQENYNSDNFIPIAHDPKIINTHIVTALTDTICRDQIPITLLADLLYAFKQDVTQNSYANFTEILGYCHYSANPIGRILLHLTNNASEKNLQYSDNICTGLQLINFMQDLYWDITELKRCYLPQDELQIYQVTIADLIQKKITPNIITFLQQQLQRIQSIYEAGHCLTTTVHGLFGLELKLIIAGGAKILEQLQHRKYYYQRPKLNLTNKLAILWSIMGYYGVLRGN